MYFFKVLFGGDFGRILQRQKHVRRFCRDDEESLLRLLVRGDARHRQEKKTRVVVVVVVAVLFFREEECADHIGRRKTASIRFG